ncbi:putative threonine--tRNA ligase, cytoplasmic [Astathelohania contejeani]|uniref:threonine--tRNA ligase n=1 Tax=Astathelohania contejeani TaxID=164912 RepID=A0ABQ7I2Y6_9MICR|nr:putative threonine--tRNA ligase, cytoplasmic [Thelohania contejeani]
MTKKLISIKYNNEIIQAPINTLPITISKEHNPNHKDTIICKMNKELYDLLRPLEKDCEIEFLTFEDDEAKSVFWHSSAHLLGCALTRLFPECRLSSGPPTEEGFYYDVKLDNPISQSDYARIETTLASIIKSKHRFNRAEKTKEELKTLFKDNKYKLHYIEQGVKESSTIYEVGGFIDLCRGPHVTDSSIIKEIKITHHGSSYFLGDSANDSLQRIYGISFPRKGMLAEWLHLREEASKRDHRKVGVECDLFFFHKYSPGGCFFLPDGAFIYNKLIEFMRSEYKKRGFKEVITPNLFNTELWEESGHLQNYKEDMFLLDVDGMEYALKPMNCPGHCIMFRNSERSFRELPLRLADFGVLHRNELSGTLTGLTRVRRFQQDDAHIFCQLAQVEQEIRGCLDFIDYVYGIFGFTYELKLSTRPEKFLGEIAQWEKAEDSLKKALEAMNFPYTLNEGDGAFYGPKIDIVLKDALKRKIQCATIQLDFQLPLRFKLRYKLSDGSYGTPVIIHRAILGSVERMIAILLESFGKRLPFWLTPRQIAIIPIGASEYASEVASQLNDFQVKIFDDSALTLNKRIMRAETMGFNLILVVGVKEMENRTVAVRGYKTSLNIGTFKDIIVEMAANKISFEEVLMNKSMKI